MPTVESFVDDRDLPVLLLVLAVLLGWGLFTRWRRHTRDLAELRMVGDAAAPRTLFQLLTWTLASDGRTARLVVLLLVVLLLVTFNDGLARAVEVFMVR
ncbi:hypothetical protein [Micromonospora halophytica]|uniref:Uncharacterized protein n=1 Tax=Micromonospora halophytica TaxID=47864 RepID=A0A1C5IUE4_9ACTN|nr:hypothetical protein [Micromonospora halophytica]SCG61964.1 hypothetical protein GA0070560_116141 [Micromonospora halophytica]